MKKSVAVLAALAIGFTYSPPGGTALAEENEEKIIEAEENAAESKENEEETSEKEDAFIDHLLENFFNEDKETFSDDSSLKPQETEEKEIFDREASGLKNLQIPQKFEVVIDPWEMDGRGQIYSEQYIISNTGDTPGILTLSNLVCRPREQSGVIVQTEKEGLHDSGDKAIYMEMLFGNEERIVFSKESCQYQTELKPGEELPVCFVGEVNENAFGKWENDDIAVSLVYSWEIEKKQADENIEKGEDESWIDEKLEEIREKQQSVIDEKKPEEKDWKDADVESTEERSQTGIDSENSEEMPEKGMDEKESEKKVLEDTDKENPEESSQIDINSENSEETPETNMDESEIPQNGSDETEPEKAPSDNMDVEIQPNASADPTIEIGNEQEVSDTSGEEIPTEVWENDRQEETKISEEGSKITDKEEEEIKRIELQEPQKIDVVMDSWNVDEKGMIASAKYMLKNTGETTGIWSFTELVCKLQGQNGIRICTDQKEVQGEDTKTVYMEMVLGNGEKVVLSQKSSEYEVKLEPGEEALFYFVGEMNRDLIETWKENNIAVTAICSWNIEQAVIE